MNAQQVFENSHMIFRRFTIDDFLGYVGEKIGRQILATPWPSPRKIFGARLIYTLINRKTSEQTSSCASKELDS